MAEKLFQPITIKAMKLKNRIIMAPMNVGVGLTSPRGRAYWVKRAEGGVGAVMCAGITPDSLLYDDAWEKAGAVERFIGGLQLLTTEVHKAGSKIGIQLWHGWRLPLGMGFPPTGESVGPSAGLRRADTFDKAELIRELTVEEIDFVVSKFGKAASKIKEASFDFVEFHGSHGYFNCQFLSPLVNRRIDKYGGDLKGRMQYGIECVKAMRAAVGQDFPVFYRIGAEETLRDGGITIDDSITFALKLEKAGVDVIDVSTADPEPYAIPSYDRPAGTYVDMADAIKRNVHVPVMAVGRINTAELAEAVLAQGKADLIAIGRQLIADPYWPKKVAEGRYDDINPCLSCNNCLDTAIKAWGKLRCMVNPFAGNEKIEVKVAEKPKKVLVIGGGPAGMQVAIVAAIRGHRVMLCEREQSLGGQLLLAGVAPFKERIIAFMKYLASQVQKTGVEVRLGQEVTREFVVREKPEVVVVATGVLPVTLSIRGENLDSVVAGVDVLRGRKSVGKTVAIIGGGKVGREVAEYLASQGRNVTILSRRSDIVSDESPAAREPVLSILKKLEIRAETSVEVEEITPTGVRIKQNGKSEFCRADTVVIARGAKPNNELANELKGKVASCHVVGDCVEPRKIVDAIEDGLHTGLLI